VEVARIELYRFAGLPLNNPRSLSPLPPFLPLSAASRRHASRLASLNLAISPGGEDVSSSPPGFAGLNPEECDRATIFEIGRDQREESLPLLRLPVLKAGYLKSVRYCQGTFSERTEALATAEKVATRK